MLNIERPQNPFIPTDEPDWEASKAMARRSPALNSDQRKDRKSHNVSPIPDWNDPLPFESSSGVLKKEVELRGGEPRRFSQSPTVPTPPNEARQTAPPIPKKPALLRDPHNSPESKINDQGKSASRLLPGGQNVRCEEAKRSFPPTPPPGRNRQWEKDGQWPTESDEPPSPRSIRTIVSVSNALMDDEIEGANTIPSLQPVRPRH